MLDGNVAASIALGLVDFAETRGADPAILLATAGLTANDLDEPHRRIPFATYATLLRTAKQLTGRPTLALEFGAAVRLSELSILGLLGQGTADASEALAVTNHYSKLGMDVPIDGPTRLALERSDGGLWLVDHRRDANQSFEVTESSFARMVAEARRFGVARPFHAVHVTHADPGYGDAYTELFDAPVTFTARRNAIRIDPSMMTMRVAMQPDYLARVLQLHADALLARLDQSATLTSKVERLLAPRLANGGHGIAALARELGMSRQTLYRQLKREGISFAELRDQTRIALARFSLEQQGLSVKETAYATGFSDPATFSRAYKRWTGRPPREARRKR